jgi:RecB family exonuclease
MVRGQLAHAVLEDALRELVGTTGRFGPEHLGEAKRLAFEALERLRGDHRLSANPERAAAALRRLEAEVTRYLDWAATCGTTFTPREFELTFGGPKDERGPVELGGLRLQGRIDRVDLGPGGALVYDYKGAKGTPHAKWGTEGKLQLALYMLALPDLLGVEAVGGLYQPLGAEDPRPRGLLREDADPDLDCVDRDRAADPEAFDAVLAEALAAARTAADEIRAGRLEPRPETCGWRGGGCSYPSICRCQA